MQFSKACRFLEILTSNDTQHLSELFANENPYFSKIDVYPENELSGRVQIVAK